MAKSMYDIIKKQNGERFAKAIRNYDNGIFEIPDIDKIVKYAGSDAEPLMAYLISLKDLRIEEQAVHMDPIALLDRAGYNAFVVDTLEKQNSIQKYYAPGEELCTFRDPHRFENYYMIHAVRKDVDSIRREDFPNPMREDRYGTSVISIQILKTGGFISIKNRYNHTVANPDNTLGSNPDNIIFGLSDSIRHHFGVDFSSQAVPVPEGYRMAQGRLVKYDYELNDVYSSENCYIRTGKVYEIDKSSEIMLGHGYLLNLREKRVRDITHTHDGSIWTGDESYKLAMPGVAPDEHREKFVNEINRIIADKKLRVEKNSDGGRDIIADGVVIFSVRDGDLTYINLPNARVVDLCGRKHLRGNLDFSGATEYLAMDCADLGAVTGLTLPRDTKDLILSTPDLPAVALDLEHMTGNVHMAYCDLSRVTQLTMPKAADTANFSYVTFPAVDLELYGHATKVRAIPSTLLSYADLSAVKSLKLPNDMNKGVSITGARMPAGVLDLSGVGKDIDLSGTDLSAVTKLILPSELNTLNLSRVKMPAIDLDFSHVTDSLDVSHMYLSAVKSLKLPQKVAYLNISHASLPAIDLDFSDVSGMLDLSNADLKMAKSLKLPPRHVPLHIAGTRFPAIDLDLSQQAKGLLMLYKTDLSAVKSLVLPKGLEAIDMRRAVLPAIDLDLSDVSVKINAECADLSRLRSLKLPTKTADFVCLEGVKFPRVDLDLSGIEDFDKWSVPRADFSAVKSLKFPKHMGTLSVTGCKFPQIDLDFSGVTGLLNLDGVDLSRVKSLKMPTDPSVSLKTYGTIMPPQSVIITETKKAERPAADAFARGSANVAQAGEPATADVFARAKDKLETIKQSKTTQQQGYENE